MRPLSLELEGFTAFRDKVCINLGELDLFAITGPTGAGKSSLIDAISYALYGRVPRVPNEVTACISQGLERMWVTLEFMAGEQRFRVYRETRRKGAATVRLDEMRGSDWVPVADRVAEVTSRIVDAVGLDYEGFTRSVLLPQGQFQEFLAGSADKRRAVLRSLLRLDVYERMRARAGAIASEMKARVDERERELAGLADATPESERRLRDELEATKQDAGRLQAEATSLTAGIELAQTLSQAREHLRGAEAESGAATEALVTTRGLVADGDGALEALQQKLADAEARLAANCFDPARMNALTLALERARELEKCVAETQQATTLHNTMEADADKAADAAEHAAERLVSTEEGLQAAEAALDDARRHDLAAALIAGLKVGDACPVCGGRVEKLASHEAGGALAAAQKACDVARAQEAAARKLAGEALAATTRATAERDAAARRVAELTARREQLETALAEALPADAERDSQTLAAELRNQTEAMTQRQALEAETKTASADAGRLKTQLEGARRELAALEQRAGAAEAALVEAQAAVETAQAQLAAIATKQAWGDVEAAVLAGREVGGGLRSRLEGARRAHQEATSEIGRTEERLKRLQADIEKAKALRGELDGLKREWGVADDLSRMLQANRFQAFVQQEALATLAEHGSHRLEELSTGRYRLCLDDKGQDFEVIDTWNADQARSVKTLSGGETFLASLALSLALAESLPQLAASHRVVLDSIFLDEGFGSLDAEALDRAADALDALRNENRLVCVVTHLQELAQRLPARLVVTKSESGSTVAVA